MFVRLKVFKNNLKNYSEYSGIVSAIAKKNNIPFIDYNERNKLGLTDDDYSDKNHMNSYGAAKFTKSFLSDFSAIYPKRKAVALMDKK